MARLNAARNPALDTDMLRVTADGRLDLIANAARERLGGQLRPHLTFGDAKSDCD